MSAAIDPIANPQAWDSFRVGNQNSPGCGIFGEPKRKYQFDTKKGKGTYGFTKTFVGLPPVEVSIELLLWLPEHFRQWDAFRPLLKYDPTKKSVQAVDVYYPGWADIDFKSAVTDSIGGIVHKGKGLYSVTIEISEYRPAPKKSAVSTPKGSLATQAGTTPGKAPDPIGDAQQREIAALWSTAQQP